jgi:hypothetical protein
MEVEPRTVEEVQRILRAAEVTRNVSATSIMSATGNCNQDCNRSPTSGARGPQAGLAGATLSC